MRRTIHRLLCLALALMLTLSCTAHAAEAPAITFSNCPSTAFRDPYTGELWNKGAGTRAVCGQHTYILPALLNQTISADYIRQAEAVFAQLGVYGVPDRPLTIYLISTAYPARVNGDTLYLSLSAFRSMEYVTALTQLYFGAHIVHGLLWAVSWDAAQALGIAVEEVPAIEAALPAFRGENIAYADMNYACFTAPYTDEAMQQNVKALALDFFSTLTMEERISLLTDYTNEHFYRRLNQYLSEHQLPLRQNAQIWGVSFHSGGPTIAVCWESSYASFAVSRTYDDLWDCEWYGTEEEPLVSSYADLVYWVEAFEEMLSHLQGTFAPYIDFRKPLIIFDSDSIGVMASYHAWYTYGYYLPQSHTIYTGACDVVNHEYVHALVSGSSVNGNMNEILAYTYSTTGMPWEWSYDLFNLAYDYEDRVYRYSENYDKDWASLRLLARIHLGHEPDFFSVDDLLVMIDIVTLHRGHATSANLHEANSHTMDMKGAKISYWHYLVRTYGEDAALRAALSDDPVTHLGADWDTLATAWIAWLQETYGEGNAD